MNVFFQLFVQLIKEELNHKWKNQQKKMSTNIWNLKYTKQRLAILQKAKAQKRHLISLIKAKSVVANQSKSQSKHSESPSNVQIRSFFRKDNSFVSLQMRRNNQILYKKIANTEKLKPQQAFEKHHCKFIDITRSISRNHHLVHKRKKQMKQKVIDEENTKIFSRLIQTSPTIKRSDWLRTNFETAKYKQNLNLSKYAKPDYSVEACKLMSAKSIKKYNLKVLRPNIGTSQTKFRNLKDSNLTNVNIRA